MNISPESFVPDAIINIIHGYVLDLKVLEVIEPVMKYINYTKRKLAKQTKIPSDDKNFVHPTEIGRQAESMIAQSKDLLWCRTLTRLLPEEWGAISVLQQHSDIWEAKTHSRFLEELQDLGECRLDYPDNGDYWPIEYDSESIERTCRLVCADTHALHLKLSVEREERAVLVERERSLKITRARTTTDKLQKQRRLLKLCEQLSANLREQYLLVCILKSRK